MSLIELDTPTREEWAAPYFTTFRNWAIGFLGAVLLIALALYGLYQYRKPEPVVMTPPAISVSTTPECRCGASPKRATNKIATKPDITPDLPSSMTPVSVPKPKPKPKPLTPAEQDFANRLSTFESKL